MKLYGVRIFVDDLDAARGFYRDTLGLTITWDMDAIGAFGADVGAQLIVERPDPESDGATELVGRFVGLSLAVDDIAAEYERLTAAGVPFEGPPARQPWGGTLAHFRDPAGNVLTLLG